MIIGLDIGQRSLGVSMLSLNDSFVFTRSFYAENSFVSRMKLAETVEKAISLYDYVDLVVIEEYAKMSFSHVAFGMGEHGGIYRTLCWRNKWPMILCPVPTMRGFYSLISKKKCGKDGKQQLREVLRDVFPEHKLSSTEKKGQDDEIDALGYALIGKSFLSPDEYDLSAKQLKGLKTLRDKYYIGMDYYEESS